MRRFPARRYLRSLHAQLFLWAVLPATFVIIALSFTGVYAHQRSMRDFVTRRNLSLARLGARLVEDGLAHGIVGADGSGLDAWLSAATDRATGGLGVIDETGRVLAYPDARQDRAELGSDIDVMNAIRARRETAVVVADDAGPVLLVLVPVGGAPWMVLVQERVEGLVDPILRFSSLTPVVALGAGVLSLLILTFGWLTIVRPLQRLAQAAEHVSWGDGSAISTSVGGVQEIKDLHDALGRMVDRIQGYETSIRDYLSATTEGQEVERARLARELHDGPVQELIALGQQTEMADRLLERGDEAATRSLLHTLREAELETVRELRRIISALRPAYLDDLGFLPALEMLVQQARGNTKARVRLERTGSADRCDRDVELAAYRIVQEALHNALQHARAQHITVSVGCRSDGVELSVTDDGIGFVLPGRPDELTRAGHFGLLGIQERVTRLGGTLRVNASPGEGTQITVSLPAHATTS